MEDESSIDGLRLSQLEQESEIEEIDILALSPMILAVQSRKQEPPPLSEICGDSSTLRMIATNLHRLFSQKGSVKYTEDNRKDLELIVRAFAYDIAQAAREGAASFVSQEFRRSKMELDNVQKELAETSRILDVRKRESVLDDLDKDDLVRENSELRDEVDQLHRENVAATHKYLGAKKYREQELEELRQQNEKLSESVEKLTDRVRVQEFHIKRKEEEIKRLMQELGEKQEQVTEAEHKLEAKKRKIDEMERKKQKVELKLEEALAENERSAATLSERKRELSSTRKSVSSNSQVQGLSTALRSLTEEYEKQCAETLELQERNQKLVDVIIKHNKLFEVYESELAAKENVEESNAEMTRDFETSCKQVEHLEKKLEEQDDFVDQILEITNTGTVEEALEAVESLVREGYVENRRLRAIIEEEMKFISSFTNTPLIAKKSELEIEIARCRQYIKENVFSGDDEREEPPSDVETSLVLQTKRAMMLIQHCEKMRREIKILEEIAQNFQFDMNDIASLPHVLSSKFDRMERVITGMKRALKIQDEDSLVPEMKMRIDLLNEFEKTLREKLNFEGQLGDLAIYAVEYIHNVEERAAIDRAAVLKDVQTELQEAKRAFETETNEKETQIANLQKQLDETSDRLRNESTRAADLESQLKDANEESQRQTQRATEQNAAVIQMKENVKLMEEQLQDSQNENERLKTKLNEICAISREKSERLLVEERKQHQEEIEAIKEQFESVSQRTKEELQRRTTRNKELKEKLKEVINSYAKAFQKQKQTIASLRQKVEDANQASLNSLVEDPEVQILSTQVKQLTAENAKLKANQENSDNQLKQVREMRDAYWKAQIAQLEKELQNQSESERHTIMDLQQRLAESSSELKKKKDTPQKVIQLDKTAIRRLEEWEKWARDMYGNLNQGESAKISADSLRFSLGEMILASLAHRQLLDRLKSLRMQKQLFLHGYTGAECLLLPKQPSLRTLLILAMACVRIQKKKTGIAGSLAQYSTYV